MTRALRRIIEAGNGRLRMVSAIITHLILIQSHRVRHRVRRRLQQPVVIAHTGFQSVFKSFSVIAGRIEYGGVVSELALR